VKWALLIPLLAVALPAQVAADANAGYRTEQQRKSVAATLGDPKRDQTQNPGEIVGAMQIENGMTVADVGTGIGFMLPYLSRAAGPSGKVIAEDIFDDFLAGARQHAAGQKLTNVTFVKGTEADANLPEGQVDRILVLDAYHHFDYPEKMLASLHRAVKPGGRLVIVDFYKRPEAMPGGRAMTHVRLDMDGVIKEVAANRFRLVSRKELNPNVQYLLVLERN
jgi:ubiquinone/menaquinone biosynthesis C-methylase UbiE